MSNKIKKLNEVCRICAEYKREGKKVVFCHGIFDILHRGQVELLARAKKLGDVLIVGVDHNYNARILKGPGRPINDHDSRIFVLSNLEPVDHIFLIPSFRKLKSSESIHHFYEEFYLKLKPDIVATCVKAGKHGYLKKMHAEAAGAKFVDIKHSLYDKNTSKVAKILGLE